ncbi:MAG: hypothetical protein J0G32_01300 [Alphaproteobacteria bacterium]|nr:hypothetical protein [Alphaproteobacteria bacterium]OJV13197.1 MAG: hypothetical protein BGO27_00130 [Alphaproteobacteria bacterium 33-17]
MPHVIIETNDNVKNINGLFKEIFDILVAQLPTKPENCKGRVITYSEWQSGDPSHASFVHITIKLLKGRSLELLGQISDNILKLSSNYLNLDKGISVTIDELSDIYKKI